MRLPYVCKSLVALFVAMASYATAQDLPVMDGLQLWLDATDTSTLFQSPLFEDPASPGDFVESWLDKSENGYEVFADIDNGAGAPIYEPDGINGLPSVRFSAEFVDGMVVEGLDLQRSYTAFIVNSYWGETKGRTLQSGDTNWLLGLWSGQASHYAEGWVTGVRPQAETGVAYLVDTVGTETDSNVFINGSDWTSDSNPVGVPGTLAIGGAGAFPGEVSDADVSEIAIYDRALTSEELTSVRNYLTEKYAIESIGALPAPDELTINFGDVSTFHVASDLDFTGDFSYAINVGGIDENDFGEPLVIGDAEFVAGTNDAELDLNDAGVVMTVVNEIAEWFPDANFGAETEDDENLAFAMRSIRWNVPPGLDVEMAVEEGESYKLQLLFGEACCDRGFDIEIEGEQAVDNLVVQEEQGGINTADAGVAFTHSFIAGDDTLNITLGGEVIGTPDNNPILNVLTLEKIEALPPVDVLGDCNQDGSLTAADLACVGTIEDRDAVLGELGALPGDLDGDGTVGFPDFLVLSANFGNESASYSEGNIDLTGAVGFPDFLALSANFGQTAAAVPEPTGFALSGLALLCVGMIRRRRS